MLQAGQLAEKLASKREAEVARREEFLRVQSMYIQRDVLQAMGLFENPSQCIVNIAPFDMNLLDIDIDDVERYAPESLVGRLMRGPDQKMRGGSPSLSNSGFQSGWSFYLFHHSWRFFDVPDADTLESRVFRFMLWHVVTFCFDLLCVAGGSQGTADSSRDDQDLDDDSEVGDEIAGTSKLEVENAWLKSELASAVAMLCNLDLEYELEEGADDSQEPEKVAERGGRAQIATQKTSEALQAKDDYAKQLLEVLSMRQAQCNSYEKRVRELEQRLAEQHMQMQKYERNNRRKNQGGGLGECEQVEQGRREEGADSSDTSAVTGDGAGRTQGVLDPMDEGVISNIQGSFSASIETRTDSAGGERGGTREGGDEVMSDVSGGVSVTDAGMLEARKEGSIGGVDGNEGTLISFNLKCFYLSVVTGGLCNWCCWVIQSNVLHHLHYRVSLWSPLQDMWKLRMVREMRRSN